MCIFSKVLYFVKSDIGQVDVFITIDLVYLDKWFECLCWCKKRYACDRLIWNVMVLTVNYFFCKSTAKKLDTYKYTFLVSLKSHIKILESNIYMLSPCVLHGLSRDYNVIFFFKCIRYQMWTSDSDLKWQSGVSFCTY